MSDCILAEVAQVQQRIGVLTRLLATLGGGQLHALELAKAFSNRAQVDLIHDDDIDANAISTRWHVQTGAVTLRRVTALTDDVAVRLSREYDWIVNCSTWLPPLASKHTAMVVFFPFKVNLSARGIVRREIGHRLRPLRRWFSPRVRHLLDSLPTSAEIAAVRKYELILANSEYTAYWTKKLWKRESTLSTPLISAIPPRIQRENTIAHVGRIFDYFGHNKRQHVMIDVFRRMVDRGLQGWHLHLIGGYVDLERNRAYLDRLKRATERYPISIHPNAPRDVVEHHLSTASIYWHASGYGTDLARNPMDVEHFGMSTVEAMSAGCVPVVIDAGGQPEIVTEGTGLRWRTLDELENGTLKLIRDPAAQARLRAGAMQRAQVFCDREAFANRSLAALGLATT